MIHGEQPSSSSVFCHADSKHNLWMGSESQFSTYDQLTGITPENICTREDFEGVSKTGTVPGNTLAVPANVTYPMREGFDTLGSPANAANSFTFPDIKSQPDDVREEFCSNIYDQMVAILTPQSGSMLPTADPRIDGNYQFFQYQFKPQTTRNEDVIFQLGYMLWDHGDACPATQPALCDAVNSQFVTSGKENPLRDDRMYFEHVFPACTDKTVRASSLEHIVVSTCPNAYASCMNDRGKPPQPVVAGDGSGISCTDDDQCTTKTCSDMFACVPPDTQVDYANSSESQLRAMYTRRLAQSATHDITRHEMVKLLVADDMATADRIAYYANTTEDDLRAMYREHRGTDNPDPDKPAMIEWLSTNIDGDTLTHDSASRQPQTQCQPVRVKRAAGSGKFTYGGAEGTMVPTVPVTMPYDDVGTVCRVADLDAIKDASDSSKCSLAGGRWVNTMKQLISPKIDGTGSESECQARDQDLRQATKAGAVTECATWVGGNESKSLTNPSSGTCLRGLVDSGGACVTKRCARTQPSCADLAESILNPTCSDAEKQEIHDRIDTLMDMSQSDLRAEARRSGMDDVTFDVLMAESNGDSSAHRRVVETLTLHDSKCRPGDLMNIIDDESNASVAKYNTLMSCVFINRGAARINLENDEGRNPYPRCVADQPGSTRETPGLYRFDPWERLSDDSRAGVCTTTLERTGQSYAPLTHDPLPGSGPSQDEIGTDDRRCKSVHNTTYIEALTRGFYTFDNRGFRYSDNPDLREELQDVPYSDLHGEATRRAANACGHTDGCEMVSRTTYASKFQAMHGWNVSQVLGPWDDEKDTTVEVDACNDLVDDMVQANKGPNAEKVCADVWGEDGMGPQVFGSAAEHSYNDNLYGNVRKCKYFKGTLADDHITATTTTRAQCFPRIYTAVDIEPVDVPDDDSQQRCATDNDCTDAAGGRCRVIDKDMVHLTNCEYPPGPKKCETDDDCAKALVSSSGLRMNGLTCHVPTEWGEHERPAGWDADQKVCTYSYVSDNAASCADDTLRTSKMPYPELQPSLLRNCDADPRAYQGLLTQEDVDDSVPTDLFVDKWNVGRCRGTPTGGDEWKYIDPNDKSKGRLVALGRDDAFCADGAGCARFLGGARVYRNRCEEDDRSCIPPPLAFCTDSVNRAHATMSETCQPTGPVYADYFGPKNLTLNTWQHATSPQCTGTGSAYRSGARAKRVEHKYTRAYHSVRGPGGASITVDEFRPQTIAANGGFCDPDLHLCELDRTKVDRAPACGDSFRRTYIEQFTGIRFESFADVANAAGDLTKLTPLSDTDWECSHEAKQADDNPGVPNSDYPLRACATKVASRQCEQRPLCKSVTNTCLANHDALVSGTRRSSDAADHWCEATPGCTLHRQSDDVEPCVEDEAGGPVGAWSATPGGYNDNFSGGCVPATQQDCNKLQPPFCGGDHYSACIHDSRNPDKCTIATMTDTDMRSSKGSCQDIYDATKICPSGCKANRVPDGTLNYTSKIQCDPITDRIPMDVPSTSKYTVVEKYCLEAGADPGKCYQRRNFCRYVTPRKTCAAVYDEMRNLAGTRVAEKVCGITRGCKVNAPTCLQQVTDRFSCCRKPTPEERDRCGCPDGDDTTDLPIVSTASSKEAVYSEGLQLGALTYQGLDASAIIHTNTSNRAEAVKTGCDDELRAVETSLTDSNMVPLLFGSQNERSMMLASVDSPPSDAVVKLAVCMSTNIPDATKDQQVVGTDKYRECPALYRKCRDDDKCMSEILTKHCGKTRCSLKALINPDIDSDDLKMDNDSANALIRCMATPHDRTDLERHCPYSYDQCVGDEVCRVQLDNHIQNQVATQCNNDSDCGSGMHCSESGCTHSGDTKLLQTLLECKQVGCDIREYLGMMDQTDDTCHTLTDSECEKAPRCEFQDPDAPSPKKCVPKASCDAFLPAFLEESSERGCLLPMDSNWCNVDILKEKDGSRMVRPNESLQCGVGNADVGTHQRRQVRCERNDVKDGKYVTFRWDDLRGRCTHTTPTASSKMPYTNRECAPPPDLLSRQEWTGKDDEPNGYVRLPQKRENSSCTPWKCSTGYCQKGEPKGSVDVGAQVTLTGFAGSSSHLNSVSGTVIAVEHEGGTSPRDGFTVSYVDPAVPDAPPATVTVDRVNLVDKVDFVRVDNATADTCGDAGGEWVVTDNKDGSYVQAADGSQVHVCSAPCQSCENRDDAPQVCQELQDKCRASTAPCPESIDKSEYLNILLNNGTVPDTARCVYDRRQQTCSAITQEDTKLCGTYRPCDEDCTWNGVTCDRPKCAPPNVQCAPEFKCDSFVACSAEAPHYCKYNEDEDSCSLDVEHPELPDGLDDSRKNEMNAQCDSMYKRCPAECIQTPQTGGPPRACDAPTSVDHQTCPGDCVYSVGTTSACETSPDLYQCYRDIVTQETDDVVRGSPAYQHAKNVSELAQFADDDMRLAMTTGIFHGVLGMLRRGVDKLMWKRFQKATLRDMWAEEQYDVLQQAGVSGLRDDLVASIIKRNGVDANLLQTIDKGAGDRITRQITKNAFKNAATSFVKDALSQEQKDDLYEAQKRTIAKETGLKRLVSRAILGTGKGFSRGRLVKPFTRAGAWGLRSVYGAGGQLRATIGQKIGMAAGRAAEDAAEDAVENAAEDVVKASVQSMIRTAATDTVVDLAMGSVGLALDLTTGLVPMGVLFAAQMYADKVKEDAIQKAKVDAISTKDQYNVASIIDADARLQIDNTVRDLPRGDLIQQYVLQQS